MTIRLFVIKLSFVFPTLAMLLLASCTNQQSHTLEAMTGASPTIIGGQPVQANDEIAQFVVGIAHPEYGVFCTGVLIQKNIVLTAAHCTDFVRSVQEHVIVFGSDLEGDFQLRTILGGRTTLNWPLLSTEELDNPQAEWGDLALLKFEGEAPQGFSPAPILVNASQLIKDMNVDIFGYGLTSFNPHMETKKLMKATVKLSNPFYTSSEFLLEQYEGRGACRGDSGGPAFARINGKPFLIGITSRAARNDVELCTAGSIYSNVARQLNFIFETIRFLNSNEFIPGQDIPQP